MPKRLVRTHYQIDRDRMIISKLYLAGYLQRQIPAMLKEKSGADYTLSQQMVSLDIKRVQKMWRDSAIRDFDKQRERELAKIDLLELEAWEQWERSKQDFVSKIGKRRDNEKGETKEQSIKTEERTGNIAYWNAIMRCIERRCAMLGLDAPQRHEVEVSTQTIFFAGSELEF